MKNSSRRVRVSRRVRMALALGVGAVLLLAAALGAAFATDRPPFCKTCHEMVPYYDAWASGSHNEAWCIDCHVEAGALGRLAHKPAALIEVWHHFSGDNKFPRRSPTPVPDSRCRRCHTRPGPSKAPVGFSHTLHEGRGRCEHCHPEVGHSVTTTALAAAAVLDPNSARRRAAEESTRVATVGRGIANVANHLSIACTRCHDMARTGCPACHELPRSPEHRAWPRECTACHAPGPEWVFAHPALKACAECHPRPKDHFTQVCTVCHRVGPAWAFYHPTSQECTGCHKAPAKHFFGACSKCHQAGTRWVFRHPSSGACTNCHNRPVRHFSGACTLCHVPGTTWAFRHPSSGACTNCHSRPAGHWSSACSGCHRVGPRWTFYHPRRSDCQTCHRPPRSHYSGACSGCHRLGRSFASVVFRHPAIPGGKHTYRSFVCSKCHPSGAPRVSCTCHGGGIFREDGD